jgi:hypothetical protein
MVRELIANTEFYTIEVDTAANRSFSAYRGFWPETEEFKKTYLANIQKMISRMRPGYTTLVDIRDMKIPPPSFGETILKVQLMTKEAGLKRSARISDQPIQTLASERIRREGDAQEVVRTFNSIPDALAWLDS